MIREILPPDTRLAFRALRALRTDLADEESFARRVDERQRPEGYRLAGAFEAGEPDAVAVAGFRTGHSLAWGQVEAHARTPSIPATDSRSCCRLANR